MRRTRITSGGAALAAIGLLSAGVSGCSGSVKVETTNTPSVSSADLQKDLSARLSKAGMTVQSVTCDDDLVGEVGKTAGCDVKFSDTNDIQAIFTATKVEGTTVSFDITPAMTKEQLQTAVAGITGAQAVTCDTGVDGKVGATANCQVTTGGMMTKRVAEVTKVDPSALGLELSVLLVLDKEQVRDLLTEKIASDAGAPPESVECMGDVIAKVGSVVECDVTTDEAAQPFNVTVTTVDGDTVNFDYAPKP